MADENILLDIAGKEFYLDLDELSDNVRIPVEYEDENGETQEKDGPHIDITKYEMYRELITTMLSGEEQIDDKMGMTALNSASIPFKLSFNTLLMSKILKEL